MDINISETLNEKQYFTEESEYSSSDKSKCIKALENLRKAHRDLSAVWTNKGTDELMDDCFTDYPEDWKSFDEGVMDVDDFVTNTVKNIKKK